ncbi:MAG: S8 family peptidase [Muribaculaceae bacterium]|nr:S8 family peptidase [Muribaculaceae bacterium]
MRKFYIGAMLMCGCLLLNGQSKIDFKGQCVLRQYEIQKRNGIDSRMSDFGKTMLRSVDENERVTAIVRLSDGASLPSLEENGAEVLDMRDDMAIVSLPIDQVEAFSKTDVIKSLSFGGQLVPKLDKARTASYVSRVHSGFGLGGNEYDGTGVVTGLMDSGLDPNHIAFYNTEGTESRVSRVWKISGYNSRVTTYDSPSEIASFTTENASYTHGTHVAGIMAGAYKTDNQYYGVATNSDIAIACGDLSETNVTLGVSNIVDYAKSVNKPAVVNLSLGTNTGAHDGSDAMSQYLDKLAEDAVICISAGNEGDMPIVMTKKFTATDKQVKSFIVENYSAGTVVGNVDIWSADSSPVSVTIVVYDTQSNSILYSMPTVSASTEGKFTYVSNGSQVSSSDLKSAEFNKAFEGYMGCASKVDAANNRYNVYFNYYLYATTGNSSGRYVVGVIVDGNEGQRVDAYCDGLYTEFSSKDVSGWDAGTTDGTINGLACGQNIIAVGSYNTRNYFPHLDGNSYGNNSVTVGGISSFSSYGTLPDGRQLPHITAPGMFIVSAVSTPYVNRYMLNGSLSETDLVAKAEANDRNNYWDSMQGTSMASPYVAGTVALWLQADPTLTVAEVREIAMETALQDSYVKNSTNKVQWGAGKINALDGMKKVISLSGVETVEQNGGSRFIVTPVSDTSFQVYVAGTSGFNATLYNMSGQPVASVSSSGDTAELDTSDVSKGVYLLNAVCAEGNYSTRVLVK